MPSWSKESKTEHLLINARAEGIETKPSFRGPVRHRRCIVTASGFYEWLRHDMKVACVIVWRSIPTSTILFPAWLALTRWGFF